MRSIRPTAWQWDLRARLAQLVGVAGLIGLGVSSVAGWLPAAAVSAGVMLAAFVMSVVFATQVGRASDLERQSGYSTILDFAGLELRDGRTLAVLRPADASPEHPGRRSALRGAIRSRARATARRAEAE